MKKLAPTIIVAALLVATATAFAVEERLKLEDSPVLKTQITKLFAPKTGEARIGFQLRREESIELDVANDRGAVVRAARVSVLLVVRDRLAVPLGQVGEQLVAAFDPALHRGRA